MGESAHTQRMNAQRNLNDRPPQPKRRPVAEGGTQTSVDVEDQYLRVRWLLVSGNDVAAKVFGPNVVTTINITSADLAALTVHTLAIDIGGGRVIALTAGALND